MITKFNSFLNEANAVIDYSIMNWIEMFKIDVTKYDKQEEPLMNKFIGIVYGAKEREPDHFGDMLHMMAGEEDPNKKIDVLTPYKGLYRGYDPRSPNVEQPLKEDCRVKKDKNGNIIEIGGQVGEWKKVDIKKDIFFKIGFSPYERETLRSSKSPSSDSLTVPVSKGSGASKTSLIRT